MIPILILQMDIFEEILKEKNTLTEEKKKQFEMFREDLTKLKQGDRIKKTH